ncbi:MAG: hypothetical protein WA771_01040 [Chthoniobacterales bacterium]
MAAENSGNWQLKKYDDGEIFGPVIFGKVLEWAGTAQIAPQDMLSEDGLVWTKAPMIPALKMDWIVKLDEGHYYGPTTVGSLLEFLQNGEITGETTVLDCCSGEEKPFGDCAFFPREDVTAEDLMARAPSKGIIRLSLQKRIRELEVNLLEKRRQVDQAADTIHQLENRVRDLEARLREIQGLGS